MSAAPINDGGPAFPARPSERMAGGAILSAHNGMSLRDHFAGKALPAVCRLVESGSHERRPDDPQDGADFIAISCYRLADAMIKARRA